MNRNMNMNGNMNGNMNRNMNGNIEYNNALIGHILRSRRIYENVVNNMRRDDEILLRLMASNRSRYISQQDTNNTIYSTFMDALIRGLINNNDEQSSGLTSEQIENATTNNIFNQLSDITRQQNSTCTITLDNFNDDSEVSVINNCGHVFFREPLRNWLINHNTCPVCRALVIPSDETHNVSASQNSQPTQPSQNSQETSQQTTYQFTFPDSSIDFSAVNGSNNRRFIIIPTQHDNDNVSNPLSSLVNSIFTDIMGNTNGNAQPLDISSNTIYRNSNSFNLNGIVYPNHNYDSDSNFYNRDISGSNMNY
jgi:hypothetical protein